MLNMFLYIANSNWYYKSVIALPNPLDFHRRNCMIKFNKENKIN